MQRGTAVEGGVTKGQAILDEMNQAEVVDRSTVDGAEAKPVPISVLILWGRVEGCR
jgi:hypothetical protein